MKKSLCLILLLLGFVMPVVTVVKKVQFKQDCSGYLKQTADANSVDLALERIDKAVDYIEVHGLTEGYTSVLWRTESENVGFWYKNVKACQRELRQAVGKPQLEQSNVLMKVRESLTDDGQNGTTLTIPEGISRYPSNAVYGFANLISLLLIFITGGLLLYYLEESL